MWRSLRTIIVNDTVKENVDRFTAEYERFGDAYAALEWLLARKPEIGKHRVIDGVRWCIHVQGSDRIARNPQIWVLYQYDDDEVTVIAIQAQPYVEETDETN